MRVSVIGHTVGSCPTDACSIQARARKAVYCGSSNNKQVLTYSNFL